MNTGKQVNTMMGLLVVLAVATLLYWLWDSVRAEDAKERQLQANAERGGELFAKNCAACHGLTGRGALENPNLPGAPLNVDREFSAADIQRLRDTIACGRVGTLMPPWSQEQGGALNDFQIEQLVALLTGTMPGIDPPDNPRAITERGWEAAIEEANHAAFLDKQLAQPAGDADTVLTLTDASGLTVGDLLRIDDDPLDTVYEVVEIVEVREAANEIEVNRAAFGTQAAPHQEGTEVFAGPLLPPTGPLTGEQGIPPCGQLAVGPTAPPASPGAVPTPNPGQPERPATAQAVQGEFIEPTDGVIETESQDNFFTLNNFTVKVGQQVIIRLTNTGLQPHNLRIAGLDGQWSSADDFTTDILQSGQVGEFTFVLEEPATLVFRCDVHPTLMWGQITVTE